MWWAAAAVLVAAVLRSGAPPARAGPADPPRRRAALLVWVGVLVAAPVGFEVLTAGRVGLIWQGRYSLPILAGSLAFALEAVDVRPRVAQGLAPVAVPLVALAQLVAFWSALRRSTVGVDGSWWFSGGPFEPWRPAVAPHVLLAAYAALLAGLTAAALRAIRRSAAAAAPASAPSTAPPSAATT